MKTAYPLLSLLSASMVVAAPAPFVGTGPVVAAGTENVVIPTTNFGRREAAVVEDFGKRALQLRGALLAARGGQGKGNAKAEDEAAAADTQAQGQDDAATAEEAQAMQAQAAKDAAAAAENDKAMKDQAAKEEKAAADEKVSPDVLEMFAIPKDVLLTSSANSWRHLPTDPQSLTHYRLPRPKLKPSSSTSRQWQTPLKRISRQS